MRHREERILKMKALNIAVAACLFAVLAAEAQDAGEGDASRWTFTAGPSWRHNVRTRLRSRQSSAQSAGSSYSSSTSGAYVNPDNDGSTSDWSGTPVIVDDPETPGESLYALQSMQQSAETVTSGSLSDGGGKDYDDSVGLALSACYDVWRNDLLSVGIRGSFSGCWNMRSKAGGGSLLSTTRTSTTTTTYTFDTGPEPSLGVAPVSGVDEVYTSSAQSSTESTEEIVRSGGGSVRWKGDLYLLGLGPRVSVHVTDWLDVYAGCEMLVGISHASVSSSYGRGSETDAQLGCGAYLGLSGWYENIGVFGQVGYDCIRESEASCGGYRAETDYSGLSVTAGLALRF